MQETQVQSLGREDPLEKGMASHSSIPDWRTPWTEEPGMLQSIGVRKMDKAERLTLNDLLTWWHQQRPYFQIKSHSQILGLSRRGWKNSMHNTDPPTSHALSHEWLKLFVPLDPWMQLAISYADNWLRLPLLTKEPQLWSTSAMHFTPPYEESLGNSSGSSDLGHSPYCGRLDTFISLLVCFCLWQWVECHGQILSCIF